MTDQQAPERIWVWDETDTDRDNRPFTTNEWDDEPPEYPKNHKWVPVTEYVPLDLLEAAEKRYQNEKDHAFCLSRDRDYWRDRAEKAEAARDKWIEASVHMQEKAKRLEAERDQALASVGAVIEKAEKCEKYVSAVLSTVDDAVGDEYRQGWVDCTEQWVDVIRALPLSPDTTAALNEMLADAWDEGHETRDDWLDKNQNPYRKERT